MKPTSSTKTPAASDEAPKLAQADFDRAAFRVSGKKASKTQWQAAVKTRAGKRRISIMLDAPIIEYFRTVAGERGYQTLINDALRRVIEGERVVADVRLAVREEMAQYKLR